MDLLEIYSQAIISNPKSGCPFTFQFVAPQKSDHIPYTREPASVVCVDSRFDDMYPLSLPRTFNFKPREHRKCHWFTIHSPSKPILCVGHNAVTDPTMRVEKPSAHCLVSTCTIRGVGNLRSWLEILVGFFL